MRILFTVAAFTVSAASALSVRAGRPDCAPTFTRREISSLVGAAGLLPCFAESVSAVEKGGVQWELDLPPLFSVQRQLASIVRVRTEAVLQADDPATGATVKLLLLPFGQQAGGSLNADEQFQIASYVYNGEGSASDVGKTMLESAARSPGILKLSPQGAPSGYTAGGDRRYVRYSYVVERCAGEIDGGECYGTTSTRRTMATITMSSISQYRTNEERKRMNELGQVRNVDVMWLLTCSAPDGTAWKSLEPTFEKLSNSLSIPQI